MLYVLMQQCAESFYHLLSSWNATMWEECVSFYFHREQWSGLHAGISAGLRYLSINSVKRGVVPDRNVLLKGICWTMPSMPWWVLKFAGGQPKARGKKGDWKRERMREIPSRRLKNRLFLLPALFKSNENKTKRGTKDWLMYETTGWYKNNVTQKRGNGGYIEIKQENEKKEKT